MTMQQDMMPHCLTLSERKRLTVSGVTEVISFEENAIVLQTCMGMLQVHGDGLQLKNLSLEGGQVEVDGAVASMFYEEIRHGGSWVSRLLG